MTGFYNAVFEGSLDEVAQYLGEHFEDCKWDCPTGEEDLEGIIDVMASAEPDFIIEVDYSGNIRAKGSLETFANIIGE